MEISCWARQATKPKNQRLRPDPGHCLQSRRVNSQEANHCPHPQPQSYDSDCPSVHHEPSWLPFSGIVGVIFFLFVFNAFHYYNLHPTHLKFLSTYYLIASVLFLTLIFHIMKSLKIGSMLLKSLVLQE